MPTRFRRRDWYALGGASGLPPGGAMPATVLGAEMVVWRERGGALHVWDTRCPHRGMRLSMGMVRGERLACRYHGWQFDGTGRCASVPARPELDPPDTFRARVHPSAERHGLIWARPEPEGEGAGAAEPPAWEPLAERREPLVFCRSFAVARDAEGLAEALAGGIVFPPFAVTEGAAGAKPRPVERSPAGAGGTCHVRWALAGGNHVDVAYRPVPLGAASWMIEARGPHGSEAVVIALQPPGRGAGRTGLHLLVGARAGGGRGEAALRLHYARWGARLRWFAEARYAEGAGWSPFGRVPWPAPEDRP